MWSVLTARTVGEGAVVENRRMRRAYVRGRISRRLFLRLGGAGLAGVAMLGAAGCGGDVIWPAQFAANGWILDLSDRFTAAVKGDKPVGQALEQLQGELQNIVDQG
jgi:hypothetical protein